MSIGKMVVYVRDVDTRITCRIRRRNDARFSLLFKVRCVLVHSTQNKCREKKGGQWRGRGRAEGG